MRLRHHTEGERSGLEVARPCCMHEKRRGSAPRRSVQHDIQVCTHSRHFHVARATEDDGPRGVARHGVPCHNFNPAMHVVAESILVSLLTSARGRVVRAHGQLASCKCASMMSTD